MEINLIYVVIYSYVLGSIPFGLILTKIFLKKDLRKIGSGNIGATNALRTGKKSLGLTTLILDVLKGYLAVLITYLYLPDLIYLSSIFVFLGHIFTIWLKFKGGKGVAVYLGILLFLNLKLAIVFVVCWLLFIFITKYASVSSITSAICIYILNLYFFKEQNSNFLFFFIIILIFTHRNNIKLLIKGKERKL